MAEIQNPKRYDLEDRTFRFAKRVIEYVRALPKTITNIEISKQLTRSSGSVGANYIEANEALSKRDFIMRIKISRKEAKESCYWIGLSETSEDRLKEKEALAQESNELMKIFGAILHNSE